MKCVCLLWSVGLIAVMSVAGCKKPMDRSGELALREQLIMQYRTRMASMADAGVIETTRDESDVEASLTPERREELDAMSGVGAYADDPIELGADLDGNDELDIVKLALEDAIRMAVENNLNLQIARITPAIGQAEVIAADAAFDAVFFTNGNWAKEDTPQPPGAIPGISGDVQTETFELATGIAKPLTTGGTLTVQNTISRLERVPSVIGVNEYYDNDISVAVNQPLLRGFGVDVNTASIVIAENAQARDIQELNRSLQEAAQTVEAAYWNVAFSREQLLIQTRLLQRTIEDRDRLKKRRDFDAAPVQITEANSFVELRRGDMIRARQAVRDASDQLKQLINSDDLPVAGETLLVATDSPGQSPMSMSLLDAVTTAMQRRPEMRVALLDINDASVRQRVFDNARLPLLNIGASIVYSGIDTDNPADAFSNTFDGQYIDYLITANLEQPIGNRAAEADFTAARLARQQSVLGYQSIAQTVVLEVKNAMRSVRTAYELIGSTRAARRAAADNLRALQAQEDAGVALTPEFINLKLQSQQRLAEAEIQEIEATVDYNNAIAAFYLSTGSLLERNQIVFDER